MQPRPSQRPTNVAYYWRNREKEIERVTVRQAATMSLLRELRKRSCADCGRTFSPHQMDFDHRDPSAKAFNLSSSRAMLAPRSELLAEFEKCDVVCAACHRIRTRKQHRARLPSLRTDHPSPDLIRSRNRRRSHARLLDAMRRVPCLDCGRRFPPCAMDFDHRDPSTKRIGVTRLVGRSGVRGILDEAAKCDIVCANCHRMRTFHRRSHQGSERE